MSASDNNNDSNDFKNHHGEEEKEYDGQLTSSMKLLKLIETTFPLENIVYVFGYGSGVFSQEDSSSSVDDYDASQNKKMIDIILVVDDSIEFHNQNIKCNPNHYSSILRNFMSIPTIDNLQRNFILPDGKVLFHVVDDDDSAAKMKYGIIHIDDLCQDLIQWESLYTAGRLHKPTLPLDLSSSSNSSRIIIEEAQHINLQSAVSSSLLLLSSSLPSSTTNKEFIIPFTQFYSTVAGISYGGDFRMKVGGEDPQKISKLVTGNSQQISRFHNMYMEPIIKPLEEIGILSIINQNTTTTGSSCYNDNGSSISWNPYDISAQKHLIKQLPQKIQSQINITTTVGNKNKNNHHHPNNDTVSIILPTILANIVSRPARNQSLKGIMTLGFRKSLHYATAKLSKGLFSRS